jgi:hypothetical protein
MKRTQRGVTMIGWIFLLIPMAIVGYAGIRLVPVYLNYTKVARTLEQLSQEARGESSAQSIRSALAKRLDIEQVDFPEDKDFVIRRDGKAWVVEIEYEDPVPLLSNISLTAKFAKSIRVGDKPE